MQISKQEVNAIKVIKQSHDLVAVMESNGIALKKQGKQLMGRCPFHEDKKPSLSVDAIKGLWHCFGCGAGGDVLGFLSKIEGKSLPTLLQELKGNGNGARPAPVDVVTPNGSVRQTHDRDDRIPLFPRLFKLLSRVVEFYQGVFSKDPRGQKYLEGRGICDVNSFRDFGVGFSNGSLLDALPPEGELLADLKALGILTAVVASK